MESCFEPLGLIGSKRGRFVDSFAAGLQIQQEWEQDRVKFEKFKIENFKEESGTIIVYSGEPPKTYFEYEPYESIKETCFYGGCRHDLCWNEICVEEKLFVRSYFKPQDIANGLLRPVIPDGPSDIGCLHPRWTHLLHDNGHSPWRLRLYNKVRQENTTQTALIMLLATSWITENTARHDPGYKKWLKEAGFRYYQDCVMRCLWSTNDEEQMLLCLLAVLAIYDIEKPTQTRIARPSKSISEFLGLGQMVSAYVIQQVLRSFLRVWSGRGCRPSQQWFSRIVQRFTPLEKPDDCRAADSYWTSRLHYSQTHEEATHQLATEETTQPSATERMTTRELCASSSNEANSRISSWCSVAWEKIKSMRAMVCA